MRIFIYIICGLSLIFASSCISKKKAAKAEKIDKEQHQKNIRRSIDRKLLIPRDSLNKK